MSEPDGDALAEPIPPSYHAARRVVLVAFLLGLAAAVLTFAVFTDGAADFFDGLRSVDRWVEGIGRWVKGSFKGD